MNNLSPESIVENIWYLQLFRLESYVLWISIPDFQGSVESDTRRHLIIVNADIVAKQTKSDSFVA